jgi:dihydroorotase
MYICEGCFQEFDEDYMFHHVFYDDNNENNYLKLCSDCASIFYKVLDEYTIEIFELKKKKVKECFPKIENIKLTHPFPNSK